VCAMFSGNISKGRLSSPAFSLPSVPFPPLFLTSPGQGRKRIPSSIFFYLFSRPEDFPFARWAVDFPPSFFPPPTGLIVPLYNQKRKKGSLFSSPAETGVTALDFRHFAFFPRAVPFPFFLSNERTRLQPSPPCASPGQPAYFFFFLSWVSQRSN